MKYESRAWKAVVSRGLYGECTLSVSGEVEVPKSSKSLQLREAEVSAENKKVLLLDLVVEERSGALSVARHWKAVCLSRGVWETEYWDVLIDGDVARTMLSVDVVATPERVGAPSTGILSELGVQLRTGVDNLVKSFRGK